MKKIIFYGVANKILRNKAERYLNSEYAIIGYTDTFYSEDILQGNRFIPVHKLVKEEFDYIVILSSVEDNQIQIRENLKLLGINEEKIICPYLLCKDFWYYSPDLLAELNLYLQNNGVEAIDIILGLSYSLRGVDERRLNGNFYNLSWHGMDLYYNLSLLKRAGKIDTALLCFPYYYLDWDMSRSTLTVQGEHIWALRGLRDWHNALKGERGIVEHIINYELFGTKLFSEIGGKKYCKTYYDIVEVEEKSCDVGRVWKREYAETYQENVMILDEMFAYLSEMNAKIILLIPPTIYLPCIKEDEFSFIEDKKIRFYNVLYKMREKYEIEIVDAFDLFQEKRYWADKTHLNENGKIVFSDYINTIL